MVVNHLLTGMILQAHDFAVIELGNETGGKHENIGPISASFETAAPLVGL